MPQTIQNKDQFGLNWQALRVKDGTMSTLQGSLHQTPPDLVVKFQRIDIVAVILWLVLRLHFVYQRQIEG